MFSKIIFGADLPTWSIFLELILCGALVLLTGARLTHLADTISEMLNLGRAWVGLLLLAGITSLPEVVTGSTAVIIGQPDLAFGNIFGSCMFNVAIIVLLDWIMRRGSVLGRTVNAAHGLSASLGIVLMALGVLSMKVIERLENMDGPPWAAQAAEAILCGAIVVTYLASMRMTYRFDRRRPDDQLELPAEETNRVRAIYLKFAALAVVLVVLTIWLTRTGDVLKDQPIGLLGGRTLGGTFVGAFFLAVATSLPEIITSITAVRIGHLDLALGNIFGSNMFNIFVIPILKVVSLTRGDPLLMGGPIFNSQSHTIAALLAILITGVASGALIYRTTRRLFHVGFDSGLIGIIYIVGFFLLLE